MTVLLDTSVLSQITKLRPNEDTALWFSEMPVEMFRVSVISLYEIRFGLETLPKGQRREALVHWFENDVLVTYADQIFDVDRKTADQAAKLIAEGRRRGLSPELGDALIAATALVHNLPVATMNQKHFLPFGVRLVAFSRS